MNDDPTQGGPGSGVPPEEALRQLRRRYDDLRTDYEGLLLRLDQLEARAEAAEDAAGTSGPPRFGILEQALAPLAALRDEYLEAAAALDRLTGGLDDLLPRGMKAQRTASADPGERRMQVDVRGRSPGELLEFRERLASLPGVASVSIHAIDAERVVLVVQLA